jgi:hypothetical protein
LAKLDSLPRATRNHERKRILRTARINHALKQLKRNPAAFSGEMLAGLNHKQHTPRPIIKSERLDRDRFFLHDRGKILRRQTTESITIDADNAYGNLRCFASLLRHAAGCHTKKSKE